jgi:hypothetical protein
MKKLTLNLYIAALLFVGASCEQELVDNSASPCPSDDPSIICPEAEEPACPAGASAGTASFSKFVAVGNSYVAGVQGGALFTEGQNNSLPAILNKQFECVGAPATFNQPSINATLGWNLFVTQPKLTNPAAPALGRMLLQYGTTPDCATGTVSPRPTPQAYPAANVEAVPNPAANPGFLYQGSKTALNNFGIPAIVLGQSLITQTGAWAGAGSDPRFSPFYGRLSYPGGSSTLIGDAAAAQGSFFLFYLGLDDYLLYAAFGGDPTKAPLTPASGAGLNGFDVQYGAAVGSLLASNPNLKGVVGNFPDIFKMPHFTSVKYNPIPLDATTAAAVGGGFAGYNAALDGLIANAAAFGINDNLKAEIATRKVTFTASCTNKILISDETLTDLGPYFDGLKNAGAITAEQRAALTPYQRVRQTTATDIIPLSTGSVLGTTVGGNPLLVNGVSVPLADQYVLIPSEIAAIEAARISYNATVASVVAANSTRLALADINAGLGAFVAAGAGISNDVTITPNINPPTGIYSEDGVHPNARGYAFLANIFIDAINAKFNATVPKVDLSKYSATGLPINP